MFVFSSPEIVKGSFELAIARKSPNTYLLILARAYGMAATRTYAVLNVSTPRSAPPALSAEGRPLIWLDTDLDRDPRQLGPPGGVLAALQGAEPPVVRVTGRTQRMRAAEGGEREAHEVELLVDDEQIGRCCWYCGDVELASDVHEGRRFPHCGGEGAASTYMCFRVSRAKCQHSSRY